jgi:hypothetical protein
MKDKVLTWFKSQNINDPMNLLQENGLVSDNAVTIEDVATTDLGLCNYLIMSGEMEKLIEQNK